MAYLATLSLQEGRRAGLLAVAGIGLGLSVYLGMAVAGLGTLVAAQPALLQILRWAGVAYLLYLAWEAWSPQKETSPSAPGTLSGNHPFVRGFIANLLNAKAAIFYVALLPRFVDPAGPPFWLQTLALGAVHIATATTIHLAIVLGASRAKGLTARAVGSKTLRLAFASAIAATALWLAVS